jgi:hypothetical protein
MTGPTGTGKTVNIIGHLQNGLPDKYVPITMSFSAQTGANQTQDLIDSKCEKRRKGVFGPSAGKEFIIFVDDVMNNCVYDGAWQAYFEFCKERNIEPIMVGNKCGMIRKPRR